jgi:steroid 5-alpha reductase family enzyme
MELTLLIHGAFLVGVVMLVLWLVHFPMRNASIVDAGWAGGLALLALLYGVEGNGYLPRRTLISGMGFVWGTRLAIHLLVRILGHPEEGRYVNLRQKWKTNLGFKFLIFFEFQALLCVVLSLPFLFPALNAREGLSWLEYAGLLVWLTGIAGESIADRQLAAFKADPASKGKTCRRGLWRYSRHPNYFFEWLIWVGFGLVSIASPYGWLGLLSPMLILIFLVFVSGIPPTEAQALRSKGDEYREYQRTTSAFVPWPPRT